MSTKLLAEYLDLAFIVGKEYRIRVQANNSKNELSIETHNGKQIIICKIQAPAYDNKANTMLIRYFKKHLGLRISIVRGAKSRFKTILVH